MPLLVPEYLFKDVTHIQLEFLQHLGIQGLVLDVDNTLTAHDSQHLREDIAAWLETMKQGGIHLMLASNNVKRRVQPFAEKLGLEYLSFCCKPSPRWLLEAMHRWKLPKSAIALVGDQLFTDHLAGTLYGARVLVVRPMYQDSKPTVKLKRFFESPFLARYYRKGGKLI